MTDEQRRVRDDSDELLRALDELKGLERTKRDKQYSTPEFHRLSEAVEEQASYVFHVARQEDIDGDRTQRAELSPNDVAPSHERSS